MTEDFIIIVGLILFALFDYFLMAKIDKFLVDNKNSIKKQEQEKDVQYIVIKIDEHDENMKNEVKKYCQNSSYNYMEIFDADEFNFINFD